MVIFAHNGNVLGMGEVLLCRNTSYIASLINEVIADDHRSVSQYELLIDILLASSNSRIDDQGEDNSSLCESLISLNTKLLAGFGEKCKLFDEANPLDCFNPKYSIDVAPGFKDYAELLISVLATEILQLGEGTIDVKYSGHYIKRVFVTVLGRFLFLYNGHTDVEYVKEESNYSNIFSLIISHSLSIISSIQWSLDEIPQLRLLILNLIDSISIVGKPMIKSMIADAEVNLQERGLNVCEDTLITINSCVEKYFDFSERDSNIAEIKVSWLYAYIYKKRFGFILGKKFTKSANTSSLPYKFQAFSYAFKSGAFTLVSNGPKVVLFEAGENKRSSEYVPTQSSAFYNPASGMFE